MTNTNDAGTGSLRQAILDANAAPNVSGADRITFAIPGIGTHTIAPVSNLPTISDPVVIDGYTQSGAVVNSLQEGSNAVLLIELSGASNPGFPILGLRIASGASTVRGLVINRFDTQILMESNGDNDIQGNFVGTDPTGNSHFLLTRPGGGIGASSSSGNRIGGTASADRNLISGLVLGVGISQSVGNLVQGNLIGTNASGTVAMAFAGNFGVDVQGSAGGNTIGGMAPGAGNVISGNRLAGIRVLTSYPVVIQGNRIGTDARGVAAIPNGNGIELNNLAANVTIGGTDPGAGNLISGNNGIGILIGLATAVRIEGNFVGTDVTGLLPLGNLADAISGLGLAVSGTTIGGSEAAANRIAFNAGAGIRWLFGVENRFLHNSIHSNGSLGIDLNGDGLSPNDVCDRDAGTNATQNYPSLSLVGSSPSGPLIRASLESAANESFVIQFFSNPSCDPSGFGEGRTLIGSALLSTNAVCLGEFDVALPVTADQFVTSTATDESGNTSEFSACLEIPLGPIPTVTPSPPPTASATPTAVPSATATPTVLANVPTTSAPLLLLLAVALAISGIVRACRS